MGVVLPACFAERDAEALGLRLQHFGILGDLDGHLG